MPHFGPVIFLSEASPCTAPPLPLGTEQLGAWTGGRRVPSAGRREGCALGPTQPRGAPCFRFLAAQHPGAATSSALSLSPRSAHLPGAACTRRLGRGPQPETGRPLQGGEVTRFPLAPSSPALLVPVEV